MSDYVIGLTGGIASGKSAVSQRFEALGITVADADAAAREAVAIGSDGLADVGHPTRRAGRRGSLLGWGSPQDIERAADRRQ